MDVHSSPLKGYAANRKAFSVLPRVWFEPRGDRLGVEHLKNGNSMPHEGWDSLDQILEKKNTI